MSGIKIKCTAIGLVAAVAAVGLSACTPAPSKPTLLIYGDSLTVLSEPAVTLLSGGKYNLVFRAQGGTAMCDWAAGAARDRTTYQPARVVLAFTGNVGNCVEADYQRSGITGVVANYDHGLRLFAQAYAGVPVTVIASPAMDNTRPHYAGWYPENGNPVLNAMYAADSATLGLRYDITADVTLTPGHVFTAYRPAYGTQAPLVRVRAVDGVHLTPAGTVYYAEALLS